MFFPSYGIDFAHMFECFGLEASTCASVACLKSVDILDAMAVMGFGSECLYCVSKSFEHA